MNTKLALIASILSLGLAEPKGISGDFDEFVQPKEIPVYKDVYDYLNNEYPRNNQDYKPSSANKYHAFKPSSSSSYYYDDYKLSSASRYYEYKPSSSSSYYYDDYIPSSASKYYDFESSSSSSYISIPTGSSYKTYNYYKHHDESHKGFIKVCMCNPQLTRRSDSTPSKHSHRGYFDKDDKYWRTLFDNTTEYEQDYYKRKDIPNPIFDNSNNTYKSSYNHKSSADYNYEPSNDYYSRSSSSYNSRATPGYNYNTFSSSYNPYYQYKERTSSYYSPRPTTSYENQYNRHYFVVEQPGQPKSELETCQCRNIPIDLFHHGY